MSYEFQFSEKQNGLYRILLALVAIGLHHITKEKTICLRQSIFEYPKNSRDFFFINNDYCIDKQFIYNITGFDLFVGRIESILRDKIITANFIGFK